MTRVWTTPTTVVTLETSSDLTACEVYVTFSQGDRELTRLMDVEAVEGGYRFEFTMTQLESGGMKPGKPIEVQVNAVDSNGYRVPSDIAEYRMGRNLCKGVL